jgi:hypothetical protein
MEKKDLIFNNKRTANKPIYQYKKISYYSKDSEDSNGEDEYLYILNAKKIKALKEKKYKNEKNKLLKKFANETNVFKSKNTFKNEEFENKKNKKLMEIEHKYLVREKQIKSQLLNLKSKS